MQMALEQQKSYILFSSSIRSDETRKTYTLLLKKFIQFLDETDILFGNDAKRVESKIIDFIMALKNQGKQYSAIHNYVSAITAFYKINDIVLNVTKISKFMPEPKRAKKDRAYTHEEIHKLLEIADERMHVVIMLLASTGMRIGLSESSLGTPIIAGMKAKLDKTDQGIEFHYKKSLN